MYDCWLKNKLLKCTATGLILYILNFNNNVFKIVSIALGCLVFCVFWKLNIPAEKKVLGLPFMLFTLIKVLVNDKLILIT